MGAPAAIMSGQCSCTMGAAPSPFVPTPGTVMIEGKPAGTIMDHVPMSNIMPFAMCKSPANPQVAAIIASSMGATTQMPCIPVTTAPWVPGCPTVMISKKPALNKNCTLMCNWAGVIQFTNPGANKTMLP